MKFEEALNKYYEHFGENYPLGITDCNSDDEIIDDIVKCIETDEKAKEPDYDDNDY